MITLETDEDRHQASLLMTAPGPEGSGRIRYAAAMYFFQRGMLSEAALAAVQRGQREALPHQTFRLSSCCRSLHAMTIETTGWRDLRFAALTDKPETATWYLADTSVFSGSYKEQCGNPS